jgi:cytoskeletal protein CcmA (bactofilin family)
MSREMASIGKSLIVRGEVTGSESLYIEGRVEGVVNLPGNRVTIGRNGQVAANIVAREIVIYGRVSGNCQASDRVDIRSEGSLAGDVIAARISIEDGAFFNGGIDIRKVGGISDTPSHQSSHRAVAVEESALAASYDARAEESIARGRFRTIKDESDIEEILPKRESAKSVFSHSRTAVETH